MGVGGEGGLSNNSNPVGRRLLYKIGLLEDPSEGNGPL